jgi:hypothetical protein
LLAPVAAQAALTWSGPVGRDSGGQGSAIAAVACATASTCVAVTDGGTEVTFNASAPQESTPVTIDNVPLTGVACATASVCAAVDESGNAITFNPSSPASATTTAVDPDQSLTAVTCVPGGAQCVAVDTEGNAIAFNPAAPAAPTADPLEPGLKMFGVVCPEQTTCVTIDSEDQELTFNPQTTNGISSIQTIDSLTNELTALTCASATVCLAFDEIGQEMSTNPESPNVAVTSSVDSGNAIVAATCPSTSQCVAIDNAGNVVSFAPGGPGTLTPVDASDDLAGIACAAQCVSGDSTGHIRAFSATGAGPTSTLIDAQAAYSAVACPTATQCTSMDNFGDEATFNPKTTGSASAGSVDPNADIVYGIACPSATQCTAVDDIGQAATFNPSSPADAKVTAIVTNHPLLAISCPVSTECVAVDDDRYAVTFDPQAPASGVYINVGTAAGVSLVGIDCPNPVQCTVLDAAGNAVTFDPEDPGKLSPTRVLPGPGVGIACPTKTECVAVDADGERVTFNPATPRTGTTTAAVDSAQPIALSCPSATYCVGLDSTGHAFEFDPNGTGATDVRLIDDPAQLIALSCATVSSCAAVDYAGTAFVGVQTVAGLPKAVTEPTITGKLVQDELLSIQQGTWSNTPTSYSPEWQRCTASGRSCKPIAGATSLTYKVAKADVGHALRVQETPANPLGDGPAVLSKTTRAVSGLPAGPRVSSARVALANDGHAQLSLVLAAARYGPKLKDLTVRLPAGVTVTARGPAAAVALTAAGRRVPGSIRRVRGGFEISLKRSAGSLTVRLATPRLAISNSLRTSVRRGTRSLRLTVAVGSGHSLQTATRLVLRASAAG